MRSLPLLSLGSLLVLGAFAACGGGGATTSATTTTTTSSSGNQVSITTDATYRYITSNGLPDHATGTFPNPNCPNALTAQSYRFRVPLSPVANGSSTAAGMGRVGVATNGVPFDPATAEWWNRDPNSGWHYEGLGTLNLGTDQNNAHVQPNGAYHYHGLPTGLLTGQSATQHSKLVGYMADGFPIYALYGYASAQNPGSGVRKLSPSWRLKTGTRPSGPGGTYDGTFTEDFVYIPDSGDLDECNGRFAVTPEYPGGTYAYFLTDTYPFIPRSFRGTPDPGFGAR